MSRNARLIALACLVLLAVAQFHFKSAASDPNAPTPPSAAGREPTSVEQAFEKPITAHFKRAPLKEVADKLAEMMGVNVMLDSKTLADAGIHDGTPATFDRSRVNAGPALHALLAKNDLGYEIPASNVLLITTADAAKNHAVVRVYDVADLMPPPAEPSELPDAQPNDPGSDIKDLITCSIEPTTWPGSGSSTSIASIAFIDGSLVVSHNLETHREIADLLVGLRTAREQSRTGSTASPIFAGSTPAEDKVRERLERREDVDFHELRLSGLLDHLRKQGLPVTADEKAITDSGGTLDLPLTFKAKQVPLKFALRSMLKEHELGYLIRDDALVVTTDAAVKEYARLGIYPVGDLLDAKLNDSRNDLDFDSLLETIASMVAPTSWPDGTGPAPIFPWAQPVVLIISQTEEIHEQIADLLAQLRAAHRAAQKTGAPRKAVEGNDPLVVRIYHVANRDKESLDQYISAIRNVIEPDSWQGRYIGKVPGGIIVRTTRSTQETIARLISEIDRKTASSFIGGGAF